MNLLPTAAASAQLPSPLPGSLHPCYPRLLGAPYFGSGASHTPSELPGLVLLGCGFSRCLPCLWGPSWHPHSMRAAGSGSRVVRATGGGIPGAA